MSEALSVAINLSRGAGQFALDVAVEIPLAGLTALIGHSGCGKTTLLRSIAGLEKAARGFVALAGEPWLDSAARYCRPAEQRGIGMVFQEARLLPHLSVRGNLEYALKRGFSDTRPTRADVVDWVGIGHLLDRRISGLSGGERQRVAIARALLTGPRVLMMDEPLASLDPRARRQLLPLIRSLPQHFGIPVLMVSHSLQDVALTADHVVLLNGGRLEVAGSWQQVLGRLDSSLALSGHAAAVLEGRVVAQDPEYPLTYLEVAGQRVTVPRLERELGSYWRLQIPATDIILTASPDSHSSMLNRLDVEVEGFQALGDHQILVKLKLGDQFLISSITERSFHNLGICNGLRLGAQFKTTAASGNDQEDR